MVTEFSPETVKSSIGSKTDDSCRLSLLSTNEGFLLCVSMRSACSAGDDDAPH